MRVAVIGATGFLGGALRRALEGAGIETVGTSYSHPSPDTVNLDATDRSAVRTFLEHHRPDVVVLASGSKDVVRCEQDWPLAERLNVLPVHNIVDCLSSGRLGTRLVLISTDYVFEGTSGGYRDTDIPRPRTNYGRSKLMAEEAALSSGVPVKVVRTAAVMGRGSRFFDWLMGELKRGNRIEAFDNARFSPTPLGLFRQGMLHLLTGFDEVEERAIHVVGPEGMSRYQMARTMSELTGWRAEIVPTTATGLFQADLSLLPSRFMTERFRGTLREYLKDEL